MLEKEELESMLEQCLDRFRSQSQIDSFLLRVVDTLISLIPDASLQSQIGGWFVTNLESIMWEINTHEMRILLNYTSNENNPGFNPKMKRALDL